VPGLSNVENIEADIFTLTTMASLVGGPLCPTGKVAIGGGYRQTNSGGLNIHRWTRTR